MMKKLLCTLVALFIASPAAAAQYVFDFRSGSSLTTFVLPSSPTPTSLIANQGFSVSNVSATINGSPATLTSIDFLSNSYGALNASVNNIRNLNGLPPLANTGGIQFGQDAPYVGAQLYTGPESAPTFVLGTYNLSYFGVINDATLTIGEVAVVGPPVPEPATWAMMLVGFGMIGAASRYRRKSNVSFA